MRQCSISASCGTATVAAKAAATLWFVIGGIGGSFGFSPTNQQFIITSTQKKSIRNNSNIPCLSRRAMLPEAAAAASSSTTTSTIAATAAADIIISTITNHDASSSSEAMQQSIMDFVFSSSSSTILSLIQNSNPEEARTQFFFQIFAGSGVGGIGISAVFKVVAELQSLQTLAGIGPTMGGEDLIIDPITQLIYPCAPCKADVRTIIQSAPTTTTAAAKTFSSSQRSDEKRSYMASIGYIDRSVFLETNKKFNPLAAYAVFDALSGGKGGSVPPNVFESKIKLWKQDDQLMNAFKRDLQEASIVRLSSYGLLAVLLLLAADLLVESAINGFFFNQ